MSRFDTVRDFLNELSLILQLSFQDNDEAANERFMDLLTDWALNPLVLGNVIKFLNMSIASIDISKAHDMHEALDRMFIGAENRPVPLHAYLDDKALILEKLAYLEYELLKIRSELSNDKR